MLAALVWLDYCSATFVALRWLTSPFGCNWQKVLALAVLLPAAILKANNNYPSEIKRANPKPAP